MKYKNYIFDLYGTLADIHTDEENPLLWEKLADFYGTYGAVYEPSEIRERYVAFVQEEKQAVRNRHPGYSHIDIKIEKIFSRLYDEKGVLTFKTQSLRTATFFREQSREYIRAYSGIPELLDELRGGGAGVYLLTNAQRAFTWDELKLIGILNKFDGIVISSDEECCKPDPEFFGTILSRYDLRPDESVMVGNDPVADIGGARAVGLDTLYIHTNLSPQIDKMPECTYLIDDGDTEKMRDYLL